MRISSAFGLLLSSSCLEAVQESWSMFAFPSSFNWRRSARSLCKDAIQPLQGFNMPIRSPPSKESWRHAASSSLLINTLRLQLITFGGSHFARKWMIPKMTPKMTPKITPQPVSPESQNVSIKSWPTFSICLICLTLNE